ncbi:hypothetical protein, partial [Streptomyces sp. CRN 30]|uniref:hypothetical protein n=1 Tax=Streptomyces sp. CRN 30 TaxID=3075613 RepID=UPI002A807E0F
VAAVLAVGGRAVTQAVRDEPPAQRSVAVPAPSASPGTAEDGPLRADGAVDPHSNEFWAQSNVTLETAAELDALTVRLRVSLSGGVTSTGAWRSLPETDFTLDVAERAGFLVYTWTLKEGRTVPAGTWVFAGQYDHDRGGRDASGDDWTAYGGTRARELSVTGGFTP